MFNKIKTNKIEYEFGTSHTVNETEEIGELQLRRGFVTGTESTGQKQPRQSPNDNIRQEILLQQRQNCLHGCVISYLNNLLHCSLYLSLSPTFLFCLLSFPFLFLLVAILINRHRFISELTHQLFY